LPLFNNMKHLLIGFLTFLGAHAYGQVPDTATPDKIKVVQDYRMELLARKEADVNTAILRAQSRLAKGFRLMILNTNDRAYAMKIRARLLQQYPDQKTYMWFADPYIKIKFGNFRTQDEATPYKNEISRMLNGATIYYLPETIEVKPDKDFNPDDMQ